MIHPATRSRRARAFLLALAACGSLAACQGREAAEGAAGGFPDEATRRRTAASVTLVARSDPAAVFTTITGLDVDGSGRVYVGEWSGRLVVLNAAGQVERTLGRRGEGPGEFRSTRGVQVLSGDSVMAYDPRLSRVTVFPPETERAAYVVNLRARIGGEPFEVRRFPDGVLVALFRPTFTTSDRDSDLARRADVLQVLTPEGTLEGEPLLSFPSRSFLTVRDGGTFHMTPHPFGREGLFALGTGDRIHFAWTDSLRVRSYDRSGAQVAEIVGGHAAPRVTDADVNAVLATMSDRSRTVYQGVLADSLPERWPAVRGLLADEDGRLWVGLSGADPDTEEWAVFTADGGYLRSVLVPRGLSVRAVRAGVLYAVRTDELDVPEVVSFRLTLPLVPS